MKLNLKLLAAAFAIAFGFWLLTNVREVRPAVSYMPTAPEYRLEREDGTYEKVTLTCDQLSEMKVIVEQEGARRQFDATRCGEDNIPACLPYYIQWKVLGDAWNLLNDAIRDNCQVL